MTDLTGVIVVIGLSGWLYGIEHQLEGIRKELKRFNDAYNSRREQDSGPSGS